MLRLEIDNKPPGVIRGTKSVGLAEKQQEMLGQAARPRGIFAARHFIL